jgi:hypothetical protein
MLYSQRFDGLSIYLKWLVNSIIYGQTTTHSRNTLFVCLAFATSTITIDDLWSIMSQELKYFDDVLLTSLQPTTS